MDAATDDYTFDAVNFDTLLNEMNKYFNGLFIRFFLSKVLAF